MVRFAAVPVVLAAVLALGAPVPSARSQSVTATGSVAVYFTPQDRPGDAVLRAFNGAQRQIVAAIYEFTLSDVAEALIAARARHVDVRVIMDESASKDRGSQYFRLSQALGSRLRRRAGLNGASGIVHNKFAVVDGARVLTGSFNWTYSAEDRNWENLVVIDSPAVAQAYARQFQRMWQAP
ncbi:MAG TPA: phospholipase D-like domain-containing protein [bacterium]|nr:phospholipase D-like domain-containing protein [bacterium]